MTVATFRFAPSPNGPLHLGHALSAALNFDLARRAPVLPTFSGASASAPRAPE
jgi:tRNA synthetase class I (E and Q)